MSYRRAFDPARYSTVYLLEQVPERDVQATTLAHLRALGIPALAVDAGAAKLRGRAWGALKRAGVQDPRGALHGQTGAGMAGLVDVVGTLPGGRALFLEIKAPQHLTMSRATAGRIIVKERAGKPTDDQLAFLDTMAAAGALVGIIWGPGDLEEILARQNLPVAPG